MSWLNENVCIQDLILRLALKGHDFFINFKVLPFQTSARAGIPL
jgi:hypothetical protein